MTRAVIDSGLGVGGFGGRAAIVGLGETEFSSNAGRSELTMATEASLAALADAGMVPEDVDGMVCFAMDEAPHLSLAQSLGLADLSYFGEIAGGGGAGSACVAHACAAIAAGMAETILVYRSVRARSGEWRFGQGRLGVARKPPKGAYAFMGHNGYGAPPVLFAMLARRYMSETGTTSRQFGALAVTIREHAQRNPRARFYGRPMTIEDHQASRLIADPYHLFDCCLETDGSIALVVTSAARARDTRQTPAVVLAGAQAAGPMPVEWMLGVDDRPARLVGERLWAQSGLAPDDIDTVQIYDHFTGQVLMQLEDLGFFQPGEAGPAAADGVLRWDGGRLPINTSGGHLSEAYLHGFNIMAEAVRQIRGTSRSQVEGAELVLASSAGGGLPTSALVLSR